MKNFHCFYFREAGGTYNATVSIVNEFKEFSPKMVVIELDQYKTFKSIKIRLQWFRNTISNLKYVFRSLGEHKDVINLLYTPNYEIATYALINSIFKIKVIFHFHGEPIGKLQTILEKSNLLIGFLYILPLYLYHQLLLMIALNLSEVIIVPSNFTSNYLIRNYKISKNKIKVIHNGVDHTIFKYNSQQRNLKKVLYVGKCSERKGVVQLLEIASADSSLNITFVFTDESDMKLFKRIKETERMKGNIKIFRGISNKELTEFYSAHAVTLLPSDSEHLPLVYLESIACGTPVLSTSVGELTVLQNKIDKRLLLQSSMKRIIKNKINWFLRLSKIERNIISKNGIKLAKNYDWAFSARKLLGLIKKIE